MKVCSSSRSRSGDAWASCSSSRRAWSILDRTVIVGVLLRVGCERSLEGSPDGRRLRRQRHAHRDPYTTLPDVTPGTHTETKHMPRCGARNSTWPYRICKNPVKKDGQRCRHHKYAPKGGPRPTKGGSSKARSHAGRSSARPSASGSRRSPTKSLEIKWKRLTRSWKQPPSRRALEKPSARHTRRRAPQRPGPG